MGSFVFFLIGFSFLFVLVFFTPWFKNLSRWAKGVALLTKLFAALAMLYTYIHVYPNRNEADIFKYFDDSKALSSLAVHSPNQFLRIITGQWTDSDLPALNTMNYWFRSYDHGIANDNRIIIRVNAVLNLITQGIYELNLSFFLLLSLLGSYFLYSVFTHHSSSRWICFFAAFLLPSTLFWSSGILKEAVLLFALGGFVYSLHQVFYLRRYQSLFLLLLSLALLMQIKVYILFALVPFLGMGLLSDLLKSRWKGFLITLALLGICFSLQAFFLPDWSLLSTIQGKQFDFIQMAKALNAGSQVAVVPLDGTFWNLVKSGMIGLFNVLFFPNIFVIKPWYGAIFALENLLLWGLMVGAITSILSSKSDWGWPHFWLIFGVFVFVVIGITVPVVGAIIRYKSPVLPFVVFGLYRMQSQNIKNYVEHFKIIKWLNTRL